MREFGICWSWTLRNVRLRGGTSIERLANRLQNRFQRKSSRWILKLMIANLILVEYDLGWFKFVSCSLFQIWKILNAIDETDATDEVKNLFYSGISKHHLSWENHFFQSRIKKSPATQRKKIRAKEQKRNKSSERKSPKQSIKIYSSRNKKQIQFSSCSFLSYVV